MSTGKTLLPSIFFIEFFLGRQTLLYRPHSIPSFRSRDSGPPPVRFSLGSDPFSHPSGSSARSAALLFSLKAVFLFPLFLTPGAQLGVPSPENVQCRAAFIQYSRTVVPGPHGPAQSNTLLTRGAVESPLNSSRQPFSLLERESGRIQSVLAGLLPHTLRWLAPALPKSYFLTPGNIRPAS